MHIDNVEGEPPPLLGIPPHLPPPRVPIFDTNGSRKKLPEKIYFRQGRLPRVKKFYATESLAPLFNTRIGVFVTIIKVFFRIFVTAFCRLH